MIGQAISGHARVNWIETHIAPMTSQAEIFLGSKDANSGKKNDTCQYCTQKNCLPILKTTRALTQCTREVRNYCQTNGWFMGPA